MRFTATAEPASQHRHRWALSLFDGAGGPDDGDAGLRFGSQIGGGENQRIETAERDVDRLCKLDRHPPDRARLGTGPGRGAAGHPRRPDHRLPPAGRRRGDNQDRGMRPRLPVQPRHRRLRPGHDLRPPASARDLFLCGAAARRGAATAVAGRYLCHERDAVDARLAATGLARACGMDSFTVAEVVPPAEGWGRTELPELGGKLEVTNLFTWSQILDARQPE